MSSYAAVLLILTVLSARLFLHYEQINGDD